MVLFRVQGLGFRIFGRVFRGGSKVIKEKLG